MYSLQTSNKRRWTIFKGGKIVLFGFGNANTAALIAKQHGILLTVFKDRKKRD